MGAHDFAANYILSQVLLIVIQTVRRIEVAFLLLCVDLALLFPHFSCDSHGNFLFDVFGLAAELGEAVSLVFAGAVLGVKGCHDFGLAFACDSVTCVVEHLLVRDWVLEVKMLLGDVLLANRSKIKV